MAAGIPQVNDLVEVRGRRWVVSDLDPAPGGGSTVVGLQSVEDGRYGDALDVVWEIEPGRRVLPVGSLPDLASGRFDPPQRLAAFLDAIRWSAVTSADTTLLQAPFRSGVAIEDYQLEPVARAVDAPTVNLLLADDVGLGKTIEAGLVAQELLLRHRARSVMIICPAGLTTKWRDEMAEKFGLEFVVVDSSQCATLRRTHGSAANPFRAYPLVIVSLPWLRGPRAQRLLDEVLPADGLSDTPVFDLLILDEAHHVAPAAPKQEYAVDSHQTKLLRRLAPHFAHRLFLSATPHNGYQTSYTALLEIIDPLQFARGMPPDDAALKSTVVRRLKRDITRADGTPRFVERTARALPVEYPEGEREVHALLGQFAAARRRRLRQSRGRRATDLVTLLLKKRLFSSPAAFAHTVAVYGETLRARAEGAAPPPSTFDEDAWFDDFVETSATVDDDSLAEVEDGALEVSGRLTPEADPDELALLRQLDNWARAHSGRADAKATELLTFLEAVCRPGGHWTNERVVVFTEYRDTQLWLEQLLRAHGLGEERLELLYGGMDPNRRELLRLAFQADPAVNPVRILLATDAASEGIDLQRHCHRLVNYDIPFNPNKLEQRIGRIDRYGQRQPPEIFHFVGLGWEKATDSYEADLEFLSRVARKVAHMEADLGSVNAVLAEAVQDRMLGRLDPGFDVAAATPRTTKRRRERGSIAADRDVAEQVRRLHAAIDTTVDQLGVTPGNVRRVVDTALNLARQQPLRPHLDERELAPGLVEVPPLTGEWARTTAGLTDKLTGVPRPVSFDAQTAQGRDDVVLAHLGHPLVAMSTRLLRAAVWSAHSGLHRATAVVSDDPDLTEPLVAAYARFVLVGSDGVRLHEEVLYAGGWARPDGRFARLDNLGTLDRLLRGALADGTEAGARLRDRFVTGWPKLREGLLGAVQARARDRQGSLRQKLDRRRDTERDQVNAALDRFRDALRAALNEEPEETLLDLLKDPKELAQARKDRHSWEERLAHLDTDRQRELLRVDARYADLTPHLFPVAVVCLIPEREAVR
ncbi:DISARM system SNF2-like helicase DrmD [Pilimelia columellifera]|uniref:DISARM system SNF2-like helicase DrmD n=1 Tax=Pilimelia columellifera subsp. columellifera TaxID=706583 RepID=A0ABP6ATS8_9ACTN